MINKIIISIFIILFTYILYYTYYSNLRISITDANNIIDNHNVKIIDVRSYFEWNIGHHRNSVHIPSNNINMINLSKNNINFNDKIIVYCNTGQRARNAAEKIYNLGFKNVKYIVEPYIFLN